EREQEILEDRQEAVRVLRCLLRLLLAGGDLGRRRENRRDLVDQLLRCDVRLRGDGDRVELVFLVEDLLRGRKVEDRERRAAERAHLVTEAQEPGDLVLLYGAARLD